MANNSTDRSGAARVARIKRTRLTIALLVVLAAATGLRLWQLGHKSLWTDEAVSVTTTMMPLPQMLATVAHHDAHPPLYYLLLRIFNPRPRAASDAEWRARIPSALAGLASVYLMWSLGQRVIGQRAALATAALMSISAFLIYYSQEARFHMLTVMLCLLSWRVLMSCMNSAGGGAAGRTSWQRWLLYSIASVVGLFSFYYYAFVIVSQGAFVLIERFTEKRSHLQSWFLACALAGVLFAPWFVSVVIPRLGQVRALAPVPSRWAFGGTALPDAVAELLVGYQPLATSATRALLYAISGILIVSCVLFLGSRRRALTLCLCGALVPFLCLAVFPFTPHRFESKHLIFATPFLLLLAGSLWETSPSRLLPVTATAVLALANAASLWVYYHPGVEKEHWKSVSQYLAEKAATADGLCLNPHAQIRFPLGLYAHSPMLPVRAPGAGPVESLAVDPTIKRIWLVEAYSPISIPNPEVHHWLNAHWKLLEKREWVGLRGLIVVACYSRR